jgi:phospholipid/cholesterol/gamma-HCH transport system ATP-binding protein
MPIGLERPDSGRVLFGGVDLTRLEERDFFRHPLPDRLRVPERALFDSSTVEDNLAFPLRLHTSLSEEQICEGERAPAGLRAGGDHDLYPGEISGGCKKRVGLLRALMLDQPIAALRRADGPAWTR